MRFLPIIKVICTSAGESRRGEQSLETVTGLVSAIQCQPNHPARKQTSPRLRLRQITPVTLQASFPPPATALARQDLPQAVTTCVWRGRCHQPCRRRRRTAARTGCTGCRGHFASRRVLPTLLVEVETSPPMQPVPEAEDKHEWL